MFGELWLREIVRYGVGAGSFPLPRAITNCYNFNRYNCGVRGNPAKTPAAFSFFEDGIF